MSDFARIWVNFATFESTRTSELIENLIADLEEQKIVKSLVSVRVDA